MSALLAFFLTFSTYGTHLPGSTKSWVDSNHRIPGSPMLLPDPQSLTFWHTRLKEQPLILDEHQRQIALEATLGVCRYRTWHAYAIHVRSTHVHAVVAGDAKPEKMLTGFKIYSTRALRSKLSSQRQRYWTDHGSTKYLWNEVSLKAAVEYVVNGQGAKMACFTASNTTPPSIRSPESEQEA